MLADWLERSLDGSVSAPTQGGIPGGRFRVLGPGLLELTPNADDSQAPAAVLSAGIHGNETAPIELLGASLARLEAGLLRLGSPVLVILGNLEAIRAGTRFVNTNLNRLFRRDLAEDGMEPDRARQLMEAVDAFYARHPDRTRLHYDLHTAIRDSQYPRFAVEPFADAVITPEQWQWLAGADIQAVLHQHDHSWTFSHYSKHYHGAQAFTLELGRALPFGANDLAPLAPMGQLLDALLEGREPASAPPSRIAFFRVEHELIRHTEAFQLCFPDDTPNFTEFAPGTRLSEDAEAGHFTVGDTPLRVVFPNARVELGARAALLVTPARDAETQ
ncbi:succinylglutamate desuccinylase [Halomonas eurihalina]|uniref:Succinylglutamate desuccinylase n=1 Tax=Halomonas eurihalina TaxID=42566 RepID=A0A5D9D8T7_HALER|nr:succinylglutamate desuccinylase [Halomonas eurihalina]MDR5860006.1 succinylglutamate desuccinylase [Halomonas eurihalina]TZG39813.1 succinylglutamate desuccinylase [Halomonas eurihalina]